MGNNIFTGKKSVLSTLKFAFLNHKLFVNTIASIFMYDNMRKLFFLVGGHE